ncbi:cytochrome b5 [Elysia marginata]|uniref:Cytochrome b5 n=1 Tax=Elysia marginata TaxID=1093978 RepID=A0AAV4FA76_9GAST|nr:cytochrome b5 [Elysia marginata]
MSSAVKKGICWALATLQVTPDDIGCETVLPDDQAKKTIDLPLGVKHNQKQNHHHHPHPHALQQKNTASKGDTSSSSTSSSATASSNSLNAGHGAASLIKDAVHSVVDTLFGSEDRENVQPRYSRYDVADHCTMDSCWIVINNRVYDVTRFLRMHPGGEDIILEYGGHDATTAFIDKGHSVDAFDMLSEYCIGEVTEEDRFPEKNHT